MSLPARPAALPVRSRGAGTAVAVLGVAGVAAVAALFSWALDRGDYNTIGAGFTLVGLLIVNTPLLLRASRAETDPRVRLLIVVGFAVQLAACFVRYFVVTGVYGRGDGLAYARWGEGLAGEFRNWNFTPDLGGQSMGTRSLRYITGLVFAVTGPTVLGGFLVFSTISFWGLYGFYRAFRIAAPDGAHTRYAALVLLWPSLVFWPSSIGKDAWMVGMLGLIAYGAARVFARRAHGYPLLAAGLFGAYLVRPHLAALMVAALFAGYLRRERADRTPLFGPAGQVVGVVVLIIAGSFAVTAVGEQFGVEGESVATTVFDVLAEGERRTTQGGAEREVYPISSPLELPRGVVTVLFRPFPFEAHNFQALLTALEATLLLVLFAFSLPRLRSAARLFFANPYVRASIVAVLLFVFAWSSVGNFGILARQRVQMLPFALVLLCLPRPVFVPRPERAARDRRPGQRATAGT